jgi:hypothetical protein
MTSAQIAANRRNAQRSTGPRTLCGKHRSRCNATRHGLTAETVIGVLENRADYESFEATILADYMPRSAPERELVIRLASLFWRLRRATAIESGLLQIQGEIMRERIIANQGGPTMAYQRLNELACAQTQASIGASLNSGACDVARCFLRLANLDNGIFERLGRYEARLFRQMTRILVLLEGRKEPARSSRQRC